MRQFVDSGHHVREIQAVGVTNQRETTVVWDVSTGKPLSNAIVWCDTRTGRLVHELRQRDGAGELQAKCGLPLSTYPSSVKLLWMLQHNPEVKAAYEEGRLAFGTVDSWLLYNLTGVHATDPTNASRTMFMNIDSLKYDDLLLEWFGVEKVILPKIIPSSDPDGYGKIRFGPLQNIPITGCLGMSHMLDFVAVLMFTRGPVCCARWSMRIFRGSSEEHLRDGLFSLV